MSAVLRFLNWSSHCAPPALFALLTALAAAPLLAPEPLVAAPHPLTGSSLINRPANSLAFAQMGFSLESIPENWVYTKSLESSAPSLELGAGDRTLLSFRLENVSVKTRLEAYVRQYLREYNQYGFEVTGLQSHSKSRVPSVIVDLKQKNKTARSRQVFFYRQDKMIIATCADTEAEFNATLAVCNRILGSFAWRE